VQSSNGSCVMRKVGPHGGAYLRAMKEGCGRRRLSAFFDGDTRIQSMLERVCRALAVDNALRAHLDCVALEHAEVDERSMILTCRRPLNSIMSGLADEVLLRARWCYWCHGSACRGRGTTVIEVRSL
jgi:hypothetical protein